MDVCGKFIYIFVAFLSQFKVRVCSGSSVSFTSWVLGPSTGTVVLEVLGTRRRDIIEDCVVWCNSIKESRFMSYDYDQKTKTCRAYGANVSATPIILESTEKFYTRLIASPGTICTDAGYAYNETLNFCYQLNTDGKTHIEAQAQCQQDGAVLAVLDTADKAEFIIPLVKTSSPQLTGVYLHFVHVGGTYKNNIWVWQNGKHVSMADSFWNPGEPNNPIGEPCLTVDWNTGKWNDLNCEYSKTPYICEKIL